MSFKVRAGTNFSAGLYDTGSDQYDYANQSWDPWTGGGGHLGRTSGLAHTVRFKITTPSTGTSLDRLDVYTDIYLLSGSAIAPLAAIIKVAEAGTNTFVRHYDPSKAISTTLSPAGQSVGDLKGGVPSGQDPGVRHFKASFTKDAYGRALARNTQYYIYFFPGGTANHAWAIMAYNTSTFEMQIDAAITTYTNVTPVTSQSVKAANPAEEMVLPDGERRIIPNREIIISWSGAKAGTANPIKSYLIQYSTGQGWVNWKSGLTPTKTTWQGGMPGALRGRAYSFRVLTVGEHNTAEPTVTHTYIRVNSLPEPPSVTLSHSGTVPSTTSSITTTKVTPGYDYSDESTSVMYATSAAGQKSSITEGEVLNIGSGSTTFYFWTTDSLEFSTPVQITIQKNTAPTLTNFSVSKHDSLTQGSTPTTNYPFSHLVRATFRTNKKTGRVYFYGKKASTLAGLSNAPETALGSVVPTSANINLYHNISLLNYLTNTFDSYVRIGAKYNDGVEDTVTTWMTYGFDLGKTPSVSDFKNAANNNIKTGTNPDHFYRDISISHQQNSAITGRTIQYRTNSPAGAWANLGGTYSSVTAYTSVTNLVGPTSSGTHYDFRIAFSYSNGDTSPYHTISNKRQVPLYPYENIVLSASTINPITNLGGSQIISFTNLSQGDLRQNYSIDVEPGDLPFDVFLVQGSNSYRNIPNANFTTSDTTSSIMAELTNSDTYPFSLDTTTVSSSNNPYDLNFGSTYPISYRIEVTNAFGVKSTVITSNITLDLTYAPELSSTNLGTQYTRNGTSWVSIGSTSPKLFEGERIKFTFGLSRSLVGTPITYNLYERTDGQRRLIHTFTAPAQGSTPSTKTDMPEVTLPLISETHSVRYEITATDPYGKTSTLDSYSHNRAQKIPGIIRFEEIKKPSSGTTYAINLKIDSLGGEYLGVDGNSFRSAVLYLDLSTTQDFATIYSTTAVTTATTQAGVRSLKNLTVSNVNISTLPSTPHVYARLRLVAQPDNGGASLAKQATTYSPFLVIYADQPTYGYTQNALGINITGASIGPSSVFEVYATNGREIVLLKSANNTFAIDLNSGDIDGGKLDGGTW